MFYYGPHLHCALKCLKLNNKIGTISWMCKDIFEVTNDQSKIPIESTLRIVQPSWSTQELIEYEEAGEYNQGLYGDGI